MPQNFQDTLTDYLIKIISETNGISLVDTLELCEVDESLDSNGLIIKTIHEFKRLLSGFRDNEVDIKTLLHHPVAKSLAQFFKRFPLPYIEEHIHLTGSLSADFIHPHLMQLMAGPLGHLVKEKIDKIWGPGSSQIKTIEDVDRLIRLKDDEFFDRYLKILILPKLILTSQDMHRLAAKHMAQELNKKFNVGTIRLKFTLSRASSSDEETIPGLPQVSEEEVVMGLYQGFKDFQKEVPSFRFILSPCFRKESHFFDSKRFSSKKDHFLHQCDEILHLLDKHPELTGHLCEVDTVGNERDLYRKGHFLEMQQGFRKLHYKGFSIRSHHGETWHTLRRGVQAVDNALNIWHIDTLEHGLSLGINPNYYFHSLYLRLVANNEKGVGIKDGSSDYKEIMEMDWREHDPIRDKLLAGQRLEDKEKKLFVKVKFHTAREVEHYQHDVLNRMINKNVSVIALPSSNNKLTTCFPDYKDHPFSWWEKKGVRLGIGTDNYVTLDTDYIQELLILLFTDPENLKITKLLMVATGETRRPYLSQMLWKMRQHS
jgi:adenosine deaminase